MDRRDRSGEERDSSPLTMQYLEGSHVTLVGEQVEFTNLYTLVGSVDQFYYRKDTERRNAILQGIAINSDIAASTVAPLC